MFEFAAITDIGPKFSANDDRILINERIIADGSINGKINNTFLIIAVADGVGGLQMGYEAATISLQSLSELNKPGLSRVDIRRVVEVANKNIIHRQDELDNANGLRTTLAALYISDNVCYVINAGDSRVYRYRENILEQLSKDHSIVQNMIDTGEITIEESYSHPKRNVITKCLGEEEKVNARIVDYTDDIKANDIFVLCSDGISDCLWDSEIASIVAENELSLQDICKKILCKAIDNGSTDNISICLVRKEN